jgi:hypothetical protein
MPLTKCQVFGSCYITYFPELIIKDGLMVLSRPRVRMSVRPFVCYDLVLRKPVCFHTMR